VRRPPSRGMLRAERDPGRGGAGRPCDLDEGEAEGVRRLARAKNARAGGGGAREDRESKSAAKGVAERDDAGIYRHEGPKIEAFKGFHRHAPGLRWRHALRTGIETPADPCNCVRWKRTRRRWWLETVRLWEAEPACLMRSCVPGHLTGSAWIVDAERERTLLTHHLKLEKWLQLGGHADGDGDLLAVALREGTEESGLTRLRAVCAEVFDVDRHWIPARKTEPAHWHYDLRFMIEADPSELFVRAANESKELAWVPVNSVMALNPEESMARMVRKTVAGWIA